MTRWAPEALGYAKLPPNIAATGSGPAATPSRREVHMLAFANFGTKEIIVYVVVIVIIIAGAFYMRGRSRP